MYGLKIKVENIYASFIYELLKNVDVKNYIWKIESDDIIIKTEKEYKQGLFNEYCIDGIKFLNGIKTQNYYLLFADFKAFKNRESIKEIKDGRDMVNSDCEIVFICTDSTNIEIYCKNENIYDTIMLNCKDKGIVSFCILEYEEVINRNMIAF